MTIIKQISMALLVLSSTFLCAVNPSLEDSLQGAVLGSALGDALGRVTEFIESPRNIEKKYGSKLSSFEQFKNSDWYDGYAPYTDDTVMAKIVLEECIKQRFEKRDTSLTLMVLAERFMKLFGDHEYTVDPLCDLRAHGPTSIRACKKIAAMNRSWYSDTLALTDPENYPPYAWWSRSPINDQQADTDIAREGGCGSVMRVWPIGLVFSDDLETVRKLAEEQSKITHRHPMARAACVAMAVGTAHAVQSQLTPEKIVDQMISAACEFDAAERLYKPLSKDGSHIKNSIMNSSLLTSEMISYAQRMAKEGAVPEKVLGTHNIKNDKMRSTGGFLLGWAADEAVAAAVYIFLRHPENLFAALVEAVNTQGTAIVSPVLQAH